MEIRLNVPGPRGYEVRGRRSMKFCLPAFRKCVDLPEDVRVAYLVPLTEVTEDSFPITRPINYKRHNWLTGELISENRLSNLRRIKGYGLYHETRKGLAKLYALGYRAVQVEYDA